MMENWVVGDWVFFGLAVLLVFCVCMAISQSACAGLNTYLKDQDRELNELHLRVNKLERQVDKLKEKKREPKKPKEAQER